MSNVNMLLLRRRAMMMNKRLPSLYKELVGFSMNNDCYWQIAGFHLRGSDTVKISFLRTANCNVFGCFVASNAQDNYSLYTRSVGQYLRYDGGAYDSDTNENVRYDLIITPTGATGLVSSSTWTEQTFESSADLFIGWVDNSSASKLVGSLFGAIEVVGRAKFIPCERIADGVLGYYDTIGGQFYTPSLGTPTSLGYV